MTVPASPRMQRFLGGLGLGYLQTALAIVVGLWLTPFLLGRLGQHTFGLWLLGAQVVGYLVLADLGIVALVPRDVAHATGMGARGAAAGRPVADVVDETASLVLCQTPLVAAVGLGAWAVVSARWPELSGPLALTVAAFVLSFPLRMFPGILQGLQDLRYLGGVQLVAWLGGTAATVLLAYLGLGLYALAWGWVVTQASTAAGAWWRLARVHPQACPHFRPAQALVLARRIVTGAAPARVGRGLWISVSQVSQLLLNGTDVVLVAALLGPPAVVVYSCTGKLLSLLGNQPQLFMQMAAPALSELRADASRERLFQLSTAMSQAMLLGTGAIACVVLAVNEGFVAWWVGPARFGGVPLTAVMLLALVLRHWNDALSYTLFCLGHERRLALTGIADGLVTCAAMFVLIPWLGMPGAALASLVGLACVSLPSKLSALAREEGVPVRTAVAPLQGWAWRLAAMSAVIGGLVTTWAPHGLLPVAVTGALVSAAYLLSMRAVLAAPPIGPRLAAALGPVLGRLPLVCRRVAVLAMPQLRVTTS